MIDENEMTEEDIDEEKDVKIDKQEIDRQIVL